MVVERMNDSKTREEDSHFFNIYNSNVVALLPRECAAVVNIMRVWIQKYTWQIKVDPATGNSSRNGSRM